MKDPVQKFLKQNDLDLHAFDETLSTENTFMLLENCGKCLGCKKSRNCIETSSRGLIEVYCCQLEDEKCDLKSGEKLKKAVRVHLIDVNSQRLKSMGSWGGTCGLPSVQKFQEHLVLCLCALIQN